MVNRSCGDGISCYGSFHVSKHGSVISGKSLNNQVSGVRNTESAISCLLDMCATPPSKASPNARRPNSDTIGRTKTDL
eukprot:95377-Amphidinium_carterae.1